MQKNRPVGDKLPLALGLKNGSDYRTLNEEVESGHHHHHKHHHVVSPEKHSTGSKSSQNSTHCHQVDSDQSFQNDYNDQLARRKLMIASVICLLFMIGEAVGGFISHSLAILTDAAHLLSDFASFLISLGAMYLAAKPKTKSMSWGWYRAEIMGALISILLIWLVTGILVYEAIHRVVSGKYQIHAGVMLVTSACAIVANVIMGAVLHSFGHQHSHGGVSNSSHSHAKGKINVRAAFIHVLGDLLQSIGVFIAALSIYFWNWKLADPICTFFFSVLVLVTTITIMRDVANVLMEGSPRWIQYNDVKAALTNLNGVVKVHDLRIWSLTLDKAALSAHIAIDPELVKSQAVLDDAHEMLRSNFSIYESTLQIEDYHSDMAHCVHCQEPED